MGTPFTATEVCLALDTDADLGSGWVCDRRANCIIEPREIWLASARMWVRENGSYVTGYRGEVLYTTTRFHLWNRWRIRCAARRWARRQ